MVRSDTSAATLRKERARFRRAVESGEKAMEALQKAQAQQEVIQAHAGSPVASDAMSISQREQSQNLGSFDGDHRKHVEPRCRATTRPPDSRIQGVESNPPDFFGDSV